MFLCVPVMPETNEKHQITVNNRLGTLGTDGTTKELLGTPIKHTENGLGTLGTLLRFLESARNG